MELLVDASMHVR